MEKCKETLEIVTILETLKLEDRELFLETKGYIKGLLRVTDKKNEGIKSK